MANMKHENLNVVAKLRSDGSVWPMESNATLGELVNLVNYKIRTEGDIVNKHKLNTTSVPTAVVDLGKQLLLYAKDSDLTGVRTMLARGAPFTSDWLGMSALHFAAMNNQYEICDVLIKGGMNKDIKTKVDRTPLHFATYYGHERIVEMLLSCKCAVNPKDMLRMTPLHWAIERRHKNIVRMLLKYNADVNVVTKFNKTPIGIAVFTEQPDILAELQVAKAEQTKKKYNEEQEKEISNAVGTILADASEQTDSKSSIEYMEVEDNSSNMSNMTNQQTANFDRIQVSETGVLDKNAINLLKSHGISMMQEEDEDGSKDLLSTALQNGRQLVLSEGGKMLLNETRQQQNIQNSAAVAASAVVQQNTSNVDNSNKQNTSVPNQQQQTNVDSVAKNNVKIVSYKEFQNMFYNSVEGKPVEKPTPTMSNMRIIRQQSDAAINLSNSASAKNSMVINAGVRNSLMNSRQMQQSQQHRQLKITPMKTSTAMTTSSTRTGTAVSTVQSGQNISKDGSDLSDIIEILPSEIENEVLDISHKNLQARLAVPAANVRSISVNSSGKSKNVNADNTSTSNTANPAIPVCFIPGARRVDSNRAATGQQQIRQVNVIKRPHPQSQQQQQQIKTAATTNVKSGSGQTMKPAPNVMPLLSTPEICRQLYEMRKQNEELVRRVDILQKEKAEMRHRLDRLEELLLVERADEETYEIES